MPKLTYVTYFWIITIPYYHADIPIPEERMHSSFFRVDSLMNYFKVFSSVAYYGMGVR